MASKNDWRRSDKHFQARNFLLSSFCRCGKTIYANVYEFCDYAISQGYMETLSKMDLPEVDPWVMKMYTEWKTERDHIQ